MSGREQFVATGLREALEGTPPGWSMDFQDDETGEWWTAVRKTEFDAARPRGTSAVTDDREWLAVLNERPQQTCAGEQLFWTIYQLSVDGNYEYEDDVPDTGERGDVVLARWVKESH